MHDRLLQNCRALLAAYASSALGNCRMPEDSNPDFTDEDR